MFTVQKAEEFFRDYSWLEPNQSSWKFKSAMSCFTKPHFVHPKSIALESSTCPIFAALLLIQQEEVHVALNYG